MTYDINNSGAPTSLTNLVEHFNNVEGVPVKRETIAGYLRLLESAKVLYNPQYLFTLDPLLQRRDGVRHLNLADFMGEEGELLTP